MRARSRRWACMTGAFALVAAGSARSDEDRGDAHAGLRVYAQPAAGDALVVITPSAGASAAATKWLRFDADWSADVVTGATPRTYGSPDVVTAATPFFELRNTVGAGASVKAGPATISAGYSYGIEHDYRSHLIRAGLSLDLAQHNTIIDAHYSHAFDSVCDLAQAGVPVTLRQPLPTSRGCFAGTPGLTAEPLDLDALEVSLTQTLTPKLLGVLVGTYQHASGFQSNPYRRVRLDGGMVQAQESHPRLRDRGAITARVRYAFAKLKASLAADLRLYRDTWDVQSLTAEVAWEQPFTKRSNWRYVARARGYVQSGAIFYRDAGNPDSYERAGPVGQYFTADQELAPLADLLLGADFVYAATGRPRVWRMFSDGELRLVVDYIKAFALTPEPPNAARIRSWATGLVGGVSLSGRF
jgi:hypothetical protein